MSCWRRCWRVAGHPNRKAPRLAAKVATTTVVPAHLELTEDLPGRVAAVRVAEIRPQVSGIVQRRLFEQGTEVRAGQPLFQINPAPFRADADTAAAALRRAEAALARARVQTTRLQPLVEADAVSRQAYDDAVSQRDQAAADVEQARATLARRQLDLKFATVEAPIPGRIDQALVTEERWSAAATATRWHASSRSTRSTSTCAVRRPRSRPCGRRWRRRRRAPATACRWRCCAATASRMRPRGTSCSPASTSTPAPETSCCAYW